jgi:hypothetical protein
VRALKPGSAEELDEIVQKVIADKLATGQLDECDLTIADLYHIRTAFVDILQGVHHPRIKYPEPAKEGAEVEKQTVKAVSAAEVPPEATAPPPPGPRPLLEPQPRPATLIRRE